MIIITECSESPTSPKLTKSWSSGSGHYLVHCHSPSSKLITGLQSHVFEIAQQIREGFALLMEGVPPSEQWYSPPPMGSAQRLLLAALGA